MEGVASARLCYEQGNDVYKSGDYISASQIYSTGIDFYSMGKSCKSTQDGEIEQKLLLNRAQCFLNMREYAFAVKDCTLILAIDNSCVKAYVRRAIAYENLGNFRKGITDTESALSLHPPSSMIDTILKLSTRLRTLSACDERAIAAEGRPDRMVTDRQTLRLNFLESIPREVTIGETFLIRLCIGNEFGLWDKKLLTSTNESQSNKNVAIIDEINQPLKVCIEIIYLDLNEYDASSASSSSSSRNAKKSLTLTRKEENLSVGSDGKVRSDKYVAEI